MFACEAQEAAVTAAGQCTLRLGLGPVTKLKEGRMADTMRETPAPGAVMQLLERGFRKQSHFVPRRLMRSVRWSWCHRPTQWIRMI